jgi:hypothetical protein
MRTFVLCTVFKHENEYLYQILIVYTGPIVTIYNNNNIYVVETFLIMYIIIIYTERILILYAFVRFHFMYVCSMLHT